ncbi:hypothetical protein GCM10010214_38010 [Streptomyces abikoensis]|nr:hypothetical protein GCM10010214_38010 [Streptomyces abikoensis]
MTRPGWRTVPAAEAPMGPVFVVSPFPVVFGMGGTDGTGGTITSSRKQI